MAFINRQIQQVRRGGWPELRRKIRLATPLIVRSPLTLLAHLMAVPAVLIVRIIRPVLVVRFQRIVGWRIGHFAGNLELYLCERDAGINVPNRRFIDFWYHVCPPCNSQLARMWQRVLHVGPGWLLAPIDRLNALIPGVDAHRVGNNTNHDRDVLNLLDQVPPHLAFLREEEERGRAGLRALGIPAGAPFVCLNVRDSAYLADQSSRDNNKVDWSYHDYRDCDIENYLLAAHELTKRGYYVVRMGAVVSNAMQASHPMISDYAANGLRTDFMDIYLGAKCAFCISNGSGFDAVPYIFRRPIVYVDMVAIGYSVTFCANYLATTKKHWLRREGRFMTIPEIIESGVYAFYRTQDYEAMGIDLIQSTAEEIAEVVLEMESRLAGTWQTTEADELLQRRFWQIFPRTSYHGEIRIRFGAGFLRRPDMWLPEPAMNAANG